MICKLSEDSVLLIRWFLNNKMKANPEIFQAIAVGEKTKDEDVAFNLENNVIKFEENVKLLGVTIVFQLNFNVHVSNICKRASKQLNVLKTDWQTLVQTWEIKHLSPLHSVQL